jgi:signal transduction histidine kinase
MTLTIRKRMALSFIFIIILTVLILEALIIDIVRRNYYKNLEDSLYSQVKVSCDLYYKYFSDATLPDNVLNNVDSFWKQTDAQVEIIDLNGRVLMDSIGVVAEGGARWPDVEDALKSGRGAWTGRVDYDSHPVMAVSGPLKSQGKVVGTLRFISSLREVDDDVSAVSRLFIVIGAVVVVVSAVISLLLANTIVGPLKEVTGVAEEMASGNYLIHSRKAYNDEIGKLSDTLNILADEILNRDRLKNEFISSISHELRTPLTSIKGWAVTLAEGDPEDREMLRDGLFIIEKESDRLTAMVEELLDFSRFVSGKVTIKKENVNLTDVVNQVCKQLVPRAEREGIGFEVVFESGLPVVRCDENRLKQVFINILDNAFKFTGSGGRVVFSSALRDGSAVFTVTDNGCGISQEELPYVRDKFYKGRGSKSGNGIGLSICDEIIRLMNGSLNIKSEVNKGTEVVITLPAVTEGTQA